jgi:hypothetical protein
MAAPVIGTDPIYSNVANVVKLMGLYTDITSEAVGTGDGVTTVFYLDYKFVVADSQIVYVAGAAKVEDTDYSFDDDSGKITFLAGHIPASGAITADYRYADIPSSEIAAHILESEDEINRKVGRSFYPSQTIIEIKDGLQTNDSYWQTYMTTTYNSDFEYYMQRQGSYNDNKTLFTNKFPILTVLGLSVEGKYVVGGDVGTGTGLGGPTVFGFDYTDVVPTTETVYVAGVAKARTTDYTINNTTGVITFVSPPTGAITANYWYGNIASSNYKIDNETGRVTLTKESGKYITWGLTKVVIVYTYGYASVPRVVNKLCEWLSVSCMIKQRLLGSPVGQDVQRSNLRTIDNEVETLFDALGRKMEFGVI